MAHKRLIQPSADRISGLPPDIIHDHILTSLPDKDVKAMSSLSKTWYHITTSFPNLIFHDSCFLTTDMFLNHVTKSLQRFHDHSFKLNPHIKKLEIRLTFCPRLAPFLDRWIDFALQHGVEDFILGITNYPLDDYINESWYDLPRSVFAAKSIKDAKIMGCSLLRSFSSDNKSGSGNSLLHKLFLHEVVLDEVTVSNIMTSCPLLEDLKFLFCGGNINRLRISKLPKLKDLCIYKWMEKKSFPIVEIDAPSLQSLMIFGGPKLTNLDDLDYSLYLKDTLSRLPSLRSLSLWGTSKLTKLKLSSRTLTNLVIMASKNLEKLEIDAPDLVSAAYFGMFAPFASSEHNVTCPWTCVNVGYNGLLLNPFIRVEDFLVKLMNTFHKQKHIEHLYISFTEIGHRFSFKKLHERVVQPVESVENLQLTFYSVKRKDCFNLLDGVFWSCHPRTLSVKLSHSDNNQNNNYVVKHICQLIIRHRDRCSCNARRRWLHHFQEIVSVSKDGTENRLPVERSYFFYFHRSYDEIKFIFKW